MPMTTMPSTIWPIVDCDLKAMLCPPVLTVLLPLTGFELQSTVAAIGML